MCDSYDYDSPQLERTETRKARKPHKCGACSETIRKGDTYNVYRQLYDGSWWQIKHCQRCWAMVRALGRADFGDGAVQMDLDCGYTWEDNAGEPPPPEVAALAFWLPGEPLPTGDAVGT